MSFELLVEVTRNDMVESRHFGAAAVCDFNGNVKESWGDIDALMFPRSSLKPFLATQIIESGACDHYNLSDAELTLACSSHYGQQIHRDLVGAWLQRLGLSENDLACGPALPEDVKYAHELLLQGQTGCRLHHNCSGKHSGLLTTALHLGIPLSNYHRLDHPMQQMSLDVLSEMTDFDLRSSPMGIDGCAFPAPSLPLVQLARSTARFANPLALSESRSKAIYRLHKAIANAPLYIAGSGTVMTELNQVTNGAIIAKNGAEGIMTAAIPSLGLGVALKIADGHTRALSVALLAILDRIGALTEAHKRELNHHITPSIINSVGDKVGDIRSALP